MAMGAKKSKISVEFDDPALLRALRVSAAERDTTMRAIVFEALRDWLRRKEQEEDAAAIAEARDDELAPWEQVKARLGIDPSEGAADGRAT